LLKPSIWEKRGNVPALARLMQAYISKAATDLASQLIPILGVCQKLLASKATEASAFEILSSAIVYFPPEAITPHLAALMQLLLHRLQSGKTPRYTRLMTTFFALFAGKFGAQTFFEVTDSIQSGMAIMLLRQVWNPRMKTDPPKQLIEAKVQVIGLTRLMCDTPTLLAGPEGQEAWAGSMVCVLALLTSASLFNRGPSDTAVGDEGMDIEIGYDSVFSRLVFATKKAQDPFADIADPSDTFVKSLHGILSRNRTQVLPLIQHILGGDPKLSTGLEAMFKQAGLSLTA
jgi:exportin-2 (importin alpha re-exporter)